MKFNLRKDDLELRTCNGKQKTTEIVKWENEASCYTLAYWTKDKEGYDLQFVGGSPFDVDWQLFMELAKIGQLTLDSHFGLEYKWALAE